MNVFQLLIVWFWPGHVICSKSMFHTQATTLSSLVPRPLPREVERGSGVLSDTWGGVKWRKECIPHALHAY